MAETTTPSTKTPRHLWVIGVVSLLWNAIGVLDFSMTQTRNEAYMAGFTPEQLDYFYGFPLWVVVAWGVATWGSLAGSMALLLRKSRAGVLFVLSFIGMLVTTLYNFVLTNGMEIMGAGAGSLAFSATIVGVGVLLIVYSRAMRRSGVLR